MDVRPRRPIRPGLRHRIALSFALAALLVAALLSLTTVRLTSGYLVDKRASLALAQASLNARAVADGLGAPDAEVADILEQLQTSAGGASLVHRRGRWYSTSLAVGPEAVPTALFRRVERGEGAMQRVRGAGGTPALVVGLPVPRVDAAYFEVDALDELDRTLRTQSSVMAVAAIGAALLAALTGWWISRRVLEPLSRTSAAASSIASGDLTTRLDMTGDPELDELADAFNGMALALSERIARDARFASDVSHELRSPLTALSTSVQVLEGRRDELPPRTRTALDLISSEVRRFEELLTDLLEISRYDAGAPEPEQQEVPVAELVRRTLQRRPVASLQVEGGAEDATVLGDKRRLERVVVNLLDNAEQHGGGPIKVTVDRAGPMVRIVVDDEGPGVATADREVIFERFARGRAAGRRTGGSAAGVGLGLALVAEHARFHGGSVAVDDAPGGGARFVLSLPAHAP